MASAARPTIRANRSPKAKRLAATASQSKDSYEKLLNDVMSEVNAGLDKMSSDQRVRAIAEIHTIAENVRTRQA
jgi:hypothetical protein